MPITARLRWAERSGVPVLEWPIFDGLGVEAVVTGRQGGVSSGPYASLNLGLHVGDHDESVIQNRARAARTIGLELDDLVFCHQTHGRVVVTVDEADCGRGARERDTAIPGADALVTRAPGVGLVVMVADCVPLVLFDPQHEVLGCVHAGWRGTVARVCEAAVDAMVALGAERGQIRAGVGPAIAPGRYQVGEDVADAARHCFGAGVDELLEPDGSDHWHFDLWRANCLVLADAGVTADHIDVAAYPTGDARFFSDRSVRPCGRFAALARISGKRRP